MSARPGLIALTSGMRLTDEENMWAGEGISKSTLSRSTYSTRWERTMARTFGRSLPISPGKEMTESLASSAESIFSLPVRTSFMGE